MNPKLVWMLTVLLLSFGYLAEAQQPKKLYRIGYMTQRNSIEQPEEAFRDGLRELGYVEGQNIVIEWRFTKGKNTLLPELASELVRLQVDCIVATGVQGALRRSKRPARSRS